MRFSSITLLVVWCNSNVISGQRRSDADRTQPQRLRRNVEELQQSQQIPYFEPQQQQQHRVESDALPDDEAFALALKYETWDYLLRNDGMSMMPTKAPALPPATKAPVVITKKPTTTTKAPTIVTKAPQPIPKPTRFPTKAPVVVVPTTKTPKAAPPTKFPTKKPSIAPIIIEQPSTRPSYAPFTQAPVLTTKAPVIATKAPKATPATKAPTTKAPNTKAPVSKAPVSKAPISKAPVSKAPVTKAPVTAAPVSKAPVTSAPVSRSPVTTAPVATRAPVTQAPVSGAPVPVAVPTAAPVMPPTNQTLLDLIQSTPTLSTLLSAIETADTNRNMPPFLASLLDNPASSLTIFAPVNSAFTALNTLVPGYLTKLLTPEFGLHLFNILGYHVTQGEVPTSRFPLSNLQMLQSGTVNVTGTTDAFQVQTFSPDPAQILSPPNQMASNGIAHSVDNVLLPQFLGQDLVSALQALNAAQGGRFSTWLQLITASGLAPQLALEEGVTFLAPTNDAITADAAEFLLRPGNEDALRSVILYHVIDEVFNFAAQAVPNILLVNTLQDENIVVGLVILDDNSVLATYNQASQAGIFLTQENIGYVIDRLLVPRSLADVVPDAVVEAAFDATVISLLEAEVVPP